MHTSNQLLPANLLTNLSSFKLTVVNYLPMTLPMYVLLPPCQSQQYKDYYAMQKVHLSLATSVNWIQSYVRV